MTKFVVENQGLGDPAAYLWLTVEILKYSNWGLPDVFSFIFFGFEKLGIANLSKSADYGSLGLVSTLKKWIMFFQKTNSLFKIRNFWYCHMSSEIIQIVTYDNYDDFQQLVNSKFSHKFISLFWGLF
jgi:hypothetical protein